MAAKRKSNVNLDGFLLKFRGHEGSRDALLNAETHELAWVDDGSLLFARKQSSLPSARLCRAISPDEPGTKAPDPQVIKVQLGFGCNLRCGYCSQSALRPQGAGRAEAVADAQLFLKRLNGWYHGGSDGTGAGSRLEFWGGEPLVYWPAVRLMAEELRSRFPKLELQLITNGTMLSSEMIDEIDRLSVRVCISHDGPRSSVSRGRDPLNEEKSSEMILRLFHRLNAKGLLSFNATVTRQNHDLLEIHRYIAERLGVALDQVAVTHEVGIPYDRGALGVLFGDDAFAIRTQMVRNALTQGAHGLLAGGLWREVKALQDVFEQRLPSETFWQRCGMDNEDHLAVDLKGRVLTCQNTTAESGHQIGSVDCIEDVRLKTSFHWSKREECRACPVLSSCRGGCMFLNGELWAASCNQLFDWHLGYLAIALGLQTGMILETIEAPRIRRDAGTVNVLNFEQFRDLV